MRKLINGTYFGFLAGSKREVFFKKTKADWFIIDGTGWQQKLDRKQCVTNPRPGELNEPWLESSL